MSRAFAIREAETRWRAEEARIAKLEAAFNAVERSDERDLLMLAMCERIWWLYEDTKCEHGDVLLEFLPKPVATALLFEFFETDHQFDPEVLLDALS